MAGTARPLDGIFGPDFDRIRQGSCARFPLTIAGAAVVGGGPPAGEPPRWQAAVRGGSVPMAVLNPNTKSPAPDPEQPAAREVFGRLAGTGAVGSRCGAA